MQQVDSNITNLKAFLQSEITAGRQHDELEVAANVLTMADSREARDRMQPLLRQWHVKQYQNGKKHKLEEVRAEFQQAVVNKMEDLKQLHMIPNMVVNLKAYTEALRSLIGIFPTC